MPYHHRLQALKILMQEHNVPALFITHPANRFYLSGFELHDGQCNESSGCLLVQAKGQDWLLTDSRFREEAQGHWPIDQVHIYGAPRLEQIAQFIQGQNIKKLWIEAQSMSVEMYLELGKTLTLCPSPRLVEELRIIKDASELSLLRQSCLLNHQVFALLQEKIEPGLTESEVAWMLEQAFRERGAEELSFAPIVGFGPHGALPHARPSDTKLDEETPVLVDMGGRFKNYCSDQTRSWWVGSKPSATFIRTLELVQQAQMRAMQLIEPGVSTAVLHRAAQDFFAGHGVADYFTHSLGHGIGLETHEAPGVGPHRPTILRPGMVITVEPGLYYPAWGGVRWEHMVVVTDNGYEIL